MLVYIVFTSLNGYGRSVRYKKSQFVNRSDIRDRETRQQSQWRITYEEPGLFAEAML